MINNVQLNAMTTTNSTLNNHIFVSTEGTLFEFNIA